jgi:hypothetical protein
MLVGGGQPHIRGDLVSGLQQDNVSGENVRRGDALLFTGAHNHRLGDHGLGQGLDGLDRLGLLQKADHGIDEHHPEDDA